LQAVRKLIGTSIQFPVVQRVLFVNDRSAFRRSLRLRFDELMEQDSAGIFHTGIVPLDQQATPLGFAPLSRR
jgi:hypothetical protein